MFYLLESLDVLSDRFGLLIVQPSHALAMRRLATRLAFGYSLHDLIYVEVSSLECRSLHRGFALATSAVATYAFLLVEGRPIICCP